MVDDVGFQSKQPWSFKEDDVSLQRKQPRSFKEDDVGFQSKQPRSFQEDDVGLPSGDLNKRSASLEEKPEIHKETPRSSQSREVDLGYGSESLQCRNSKSRNIGESGRIDKDGERVADQWFADDGGKTPMQSMGRTDMHGSRIWDPGG
ncbi:hypothetical protein DPMN_097023 [Dreissena polymorpha]|uniref:Uncharacterized protein n=1 Tax=Dreissena polymorpha TaxID=45954 RepID=A0A9D4L9I6_DREPO|nr:hypothetical protein DPMN_097023 [Dreissena polymorpha]